MDETSKTKRIWGPLEKAILQGSGIDIGCGPDPVAPGVRKFDLADGDANHITRYVHEQFDFVYSSHCLEHMADPRSALHEWWRLVKPRGHLFFIVPDEDLYEQGVFPSRFNPDHRATFTISKAQSWSPVSINVLDLARSLPGAELVSLALQDHGYERPLLWPGGSTHAWLPLRIAFRIYRGLRSRGLLAKIAFVELWQSRCRPVDQTLRPDVLAQIQCIVRKVS